MENLFVLLFFRKNNSKISFLNKKSIHEECFFAKCMATSSVNASFTVHILYLKIMENTRNYLNTANLIHLVSF